MPVKRTFGWIQNPGDLKKLKLEYSNVTDTCKISRSGQKLALSEDDSQSEREALTEALLSYPPVIRILSLLKKNGEKTKFELGNQLRFICELGFTSVPQEILLSG